jgi:hypothetical protein
MSSELACQLVLSLATVTVLLSSIEALVGYRAVVAVGCGTYAVPTSWIWSTARSIYGIRALCSVALLLLLAFDVSGGITSALVVVLALLLVFSMYLFSLGQDGAEDASIMVLVAATLTQFAGGHGEVLFLVFCVAQHGVVFATAGLGKLFAPWWGTGDALRRIFQNPALGARWAHELVLRHPRATAMAERSLIVLQLGLAISWLLPPPVALVVLLAGLAFHVISAVASGLYKFVWVFSALDVAAFWASTAIWSSQ